MELEVCVCNSLIDWLPCTVSSSQSRKNHMLWTCRLFYRPGHYSYRSRLFCTNGHIAGKKQVEKCNSCPVDRSMREGVAVVGMSSCSSYREGCPKACQRKPPTPKKHDGCSCAFVVPWEEVKGDCQLNSSCCQWRCLAASPQCWISATACAATFPRSSKPPSTPLAPCCCTSTTYRLVVPGGGIYVGFSQTYRFANYGI